MKTSPESFGANEVAEANVIDDKIIYQSPCDNTKDREIPWALDFWSMQMSLLRCAIRVVGPTHRNFATS